MRAGDTIEPEPPQAASADDRLDVVAVGSPLVDVLTRTNDDELRRIGLTKGAMTLVDLTEAARVYREMGPGTEKSGGSAANTAVGVASLGGRAGFVGKVSADELGEVFVHDMAASGVELGKVAIAEVSDDPGADAATGRCLVFVTDDGERTMATHLGVASTLGPGDLDEDLVTRAQVVYLEGYLWDVDVAKSAMRRAMELAHSTDSLVALTLSDPFCVQRHQREFLDLLHESVDVLFANDEEARLLFGSPDLEHAISSISETGVLAGVTRGPLGSVAVSASGPCYVEAEPVELVVDTTGAGDLYASGFLYGLTHGYEPGRCARLGGLCAAEVISHIGARPEKDLRSLV